MANQKQSVGAGSRARSWTGNSEGGVCAARARPSRALGAASLAVKPRRDRGAHGTESLPQFIPRAKKGKGEIHFVTELGTRLHRPLWVTADLFFLGELTRRAGEDGRGALLELGNLTINSLTPGYT